MGVLTPDQFPDFLETNFSVIHENVGQAPIQGLQMYSVKNTSLDHEKHTGMVGFTTMPQNRDSEDIPMGEVIQGHDNTYTPVGYRLGYRFEDKLRRTSQYGFIGRVQRALITSSRDTIELHAVLPFNTTFGTGTAPWLCADGMYLCDDSRPREDGGTSRDNLESGALTESALETMDLAFAANVNGRGMKRPLSMHTLVVSRSKSRKARELLNSTLTPEDSMNAVNVYKGQYKLIVWDYLTSGYWFGLAGDEEDQQLYWYWGVQPNVKTWTSGENTDVTIQRIKMAFTAGCDVPRGIRGSPGA